ncbi:MAG: sigma-54-dependent Fis family transcriptional regulator [Bacteroides sp.]|nr:sigma-54-dependent Fis family transcriptional regulator [Bacteroides sp.]
MSIQEEITSVCRRFSIIGNSPALIHAIERAVKVAPIDLSVLVTGESGSGKEFFPRIIHNSGARKHKKYIAVNCGAIPEGTIDSELFGHEKGAFTGAISTRKGYFEEADGGTIFLDEVAELPLTTQARLLRVLESGEFLKVGSSTVQKTDVRIVAATNVNLPEAVAAGRFREDLYYRLSTVIIDVPPLNERGDDILLLARKFAADFSEKYLTEPISFSEEAQHAMTLYRWPGNVRQLKNVVEQLALFNAGEEISRREFIDALPTPAREGAEGKHVPYADRHSYEQEREFLWQTLFAMRAEISELKGALGLADRHGDENQSAGGGRPALLPRLAPRQASAKDLLAPEEELLRMSTDLTSTGSGNDRIQAVTAADPLTLEEAEKEAVANALRRNNGDKKLAAEQLNISQRTLYRKIKEYGLD